VKDEVICLSERSIGAEEGTIRPLPRERGPFLSNNLFYAVPPELLSRLENITIDSASLTPDSHQRVQSRLERAEPLSCWIAASVFGYTANSSVYGQRGKRTKHCLLPYRDLASNPFGISARTALVPGF